MPDRLKSAGFAGLFEPSRSGADMADFVAIDAPQDRRRATVSRRYESLDRRRGHVQPPGLQHHRHRSEEHTSELQSLMRISYAVFCLKKKKTQQATPNT